ncbi:helix-turn-helix transcriptional regulator [Paenibacillus cremeus]
MFEPKYMIGDDEFSIQYMYKKGYSTMAEPHFHPFYEIYYLMQGERIYFINGKVYTAERGDLIVINPHDVHLTTSTEVPEFERILINFKHEFVHGSSPPPEQAWLPFAQGSSLIRFPMKDQAVNEQLIKEMLAECKGQQEGYKDYVRLLLSQLLLRIHRQSLQGNHEPERYAHPMHKKITEIATFLNDHYQDDVTLEQISKQFYISPSYLSRVFKKITGFHFREYLQIVRVKEAQKQLRETKDKIVTIAEQTGFGHVSHFNTTFKKIVGVSPLRYRKQMNMER